MLHISIHPVRHQSVRRRQIEGKVSAQAAIGRQADECTDCNGHNGDSHDRSPGEEALGKVFGVRADHAEVRVIWLPVEEGHACVVNTEEEQGPAAYPCHRAGDETDAIRLVMLLAGRWAMRRGSAFRAEMATEKDRGGETN